MKFIDRFAALFFTPAGYQPSSVTVHLSIPPPDPETVTAIQVLATSGCQWHVTFAPRGVWESSFNGEPLKPCRTVDETLQRLGAEAMRFG